MYVFFLTVIGPEHHPVTVFHDGEGSQLDVGQRNLLPIYLHLELLHQGDLRTLRQPHRDGPGPVEGLVTNTTILRTFPYQGVCLIVLQEAMKSFTFPDMINSISTENPQKCSKLYNISLESLEDSVYVLDNFSKGEA